MLELLNGVCEGKWACVRKALREQSSEMAEGLSERDYKTALQIGTKYNYSDGEVLAYYQDTGEMNWACARTYYRNMYMDTKETGKPTK